MSSLISVFKYNKNHDPKNGRFASGKGGGSGKSSVHAVNMDVKRYLDKERAYTKLSQAAFDMYSSDPAKVARGKEADKKAKALHKELSAHYTAEHQRLGPRFARSSGASLILGFLPKATAKNVQRQIDRTETHRYNEAKARGDFKPSYRARSGVDADMAYRERLAERRVRRRKAEDDITEEELAAAMQKAESMSDEELEAMIAELNAEEVTKGSGKKCKKKKKLPVMKDDFLSILKGKKKPMKDEDEEDMKEVDDAEEEDMEDEEETPKKSKGKGKKMKPEPKKAKYIKDADSDDDGVTDDEEEDVEKSDYSKVFKFNKHHDPKTGRFASSGSGGKSKGKSTGAKAGYREVWPSINAGGSGLRLSKEMMRSAGIKPKLVKIGVKAKTKPKMSSQVSSLRRALGRSLDGDSPRSAYQILGSYPKSVRAKLMQQTKYGDIAEAIASYSRRRRPKYRKG